MPIPTTIPSGVFNAQIYDIGDMISLSPSFQAFVGAANQNDAWEHIALVATERLIVPRNRAIVAPSRNPRLDELGYAAGSNVVIFEMDVPEEFKKTEESEGGLDPTGIQIQFENAVSHICSDVVATARNGGHLLLESMTRMENPWRCDLDENDEQDSRLDYFVCRVQVTWGPKK
jgi:hypothetical protein